jgi:hypothetical protein
VGKGEKNSLVGGNKDVKGSEGVEENISSHYSETSHGKLGKGGSYNKIPFIILASVSLIGLMGVMIAKIAH